MPRNLLRFFLVLLVLGLTAACTREPEQAPPDMLQYVPADTPYVFVAGKQLPDGLRARLADHYAAELAVQRAALLKVRTQLQASDEVAAATREAGDYFHVLDALLAEFEGRETAAALRELGIEPVARSVFYGIGILPALRIEIADAARLDALLDRVAERAGLDVARSSLGEQAYRRIDLGGVDLVLSVTQTHLIAGLLTDAMFDRHLPLLLGQQAPARSLAASGEIEALIKRHGFTGYGEGFVKLHDLTGILLGKGSGLNAEVMQALGAEPPALTTGCGALAETMTAAMPRLVMGITRADDRQMVTRGVWESTPVVAQYLGKLAAPVPGVGGTYDGLLAVGLGIELPQLRNALDALLRHLIAAGSACEWVDSDGLEAMIPQLNLALGPMTAGLKGFNLKIDDVELDPDTLEPRNVRASLLAAIDDPRGLLALGAMFSPALAALEIPADGSFVDLPQDLGLQEKTPPLKVAVRDRALLLLAGADDAGPDDWPRDTGTAAPTPLFAIDYGLLLLVERFGDLSDRAATQLRSQGETEMAEELTDQVAGFRHQARLFERQRVTLHASAEGLVMDQVMELR